MHTDRASPHEYCHACHASFAVLRACTALPPLLDMAFWCMRVALAHAVQPSHSGYTILDGISFHRPVLAWAVYLSVCQSGMSCLEGEVYLMPISNLGDTSYLDIVTLTLHTTPPD